MNEVSHTMRRAWQRRLIRFTMVTVFQILKMFWFVSRPRTKGVSAFCLTPQRRLILVYSTYESGWNLPSGGIRGGESTSAAIIRELREELGLTAYGDIECLGSLYHRPNFKRDHETVFLLREVAYEQIRSLEIERIGSFPIDALPSDISSELSQRLARFGETVRKLS